ncbi:unnamed protein product [Lactuca virosa]|uniref:Glabrous enhancer-binding protein-like DBD domain-containing protein n=1 Tax=Lactuca virosa TaxID=75947 RepID=A0AAU9P326_9ASTR|nr:unnamed protein product [Lactuca virosa]
MAEADPDPKHLPHDGSEPPNKRKKITNAIISGGSSQWKHPNEIEDTATSKPENEEIQEVDYDTIEIMQEILAYRNRKGVWPCESPDDLKRFCFPYIHVGIGNEGGWLKKMEEMKNKFNNESAPMEDVDKKEFELWKKIWGNEQKGDDDDDDDD